LKGKDMTDYRIIEVEEKSYLYNERSCSMDPNDISQNMGIAFHTVPGNAWSNAGSRMSVPHRRSGARQCGWGVIGSKHFAAID
jgi:hypothetical protein